MKTVNECPSVIYLVKKDELENIDRDVLLLGFSDDNYVWVYTTDWDLNKIYNGNAYTFDELIHFERTLVATKLATETIAFLENVRDNYVDPWKKTDSSNSFKLCSCEMRTLMMSGCQCGGN